MKFIIEKYYYMLMWLEDILDGMSTAVNNHRGRVDKKFWEKYLKI